jgi:predicted hotdog family 3-hydroxylacyl-ACP dehydratase
VTETSATLPAAGELVRHSGTMLLIGRLTEASETHAVSEVAIDEGSTFYREGRGVPAYVGLEYMAQTIAAYDGVERRRTGKPPEIGFLLGTRRFEASRPWFEAGETLRIRVDMTFNDNGMAAFDGVITVANEERARASINVYRPESGGLGNLAGVAR